MKTTAIMNLKGGVAKSITAVNMAAILAAKHGKRVLLIDADPQGNTSSFFPVLPDDCTLREILVGENEPYWGETVYGSSIAGLHFIPSDMSLATLDVSVGEQKDAEECRRQLYRLREFLLAAAEDDAFDHCIIDMPPSFTTSAKAALIAADEVIIPMKIDAFSLKGMRVLMDQIATMRKINERLRLAGVLITMHQSAEAVSVAKKILKERKIPAFQTAIRWTKRKVDDSTMAKLPLHQFSPRCGASRDYISFVKEYLGGEQNG